MDKDWTGNKNSIFKTLGASNHTTKERENNDYYATDPIAIDSLIMGGGKFPIKCGKQPVAKDTYQRDSKNMDMKYILQT